MCRTSSLHGWVSRLAGMVIVTAMILPSSLAAQGVPPGKEQAKSPSPKSAAHHPTRTKGPGEPIRLAVLTVAVNTPVFVQAYDRFRSLHGSDKLVLDLWVEQEWAESPRPLELERYDMILALRCSIPGLEKAVATAAAKGGMGRQRLPAASTAIAPNRSTPCRISLPTTANAACRTWSDCWKRFARPFECRASRPERSRSCPPRESTIQTLTAYSPTGQVIGNGMPRVPAISPRRRKSAFSSTTRCT